MDHSWIINNNKYNDDECYTYLVYLLCDGHWNKRTAFQQPFISN